MLDPTAATVHEADRVRRMGHDDVRAIQTGYPLEVAALPVDSYVVGLRDVGVMAQNGRGTLWVVEV